MTSVFERIPTCFIAVIARISIGTVFLRSGILKVEGWSDGTTLALFTDEYKLPLIAPKAAVWLATTAELTLPVLLLLGFLTRYAALGLLCMTLVIETFVYPSAFDTHGVWAVSLLFLIRHGAGPLSVDRLLQPGGRETTDALETRP